MRRTVLVNALVTVTSTFVALLLVEAGLRLLQPQPLAAVGRSARLGWMHKPNARFVYERDEYRVPIQYSSMGLRDREYSRVKPASTYRIALLGDSFVEALQVPADSMLSRLLEHELSAHAQAPRFEVMNFGVSGYGSCQQLVLLEERVLDYAPDLVLAVHYHNDFDDNARFGLCGLGADGRLQLQDPAQLGWFTRLQSGIKSALWQRSHLFNFVSTRQLRHSMQAQTTPQRPADGGEGASADRHAGAEQLELQMTRVQETAAARRALALHAAILERMQVRCADAGAGFVAILGVSAGQVDDTRLPADFTSGQHDVALLNRRLAERLDQHGVPVVDLLPAFRAARGRRLFFTVDGHWTAEGHRAAAHGIGRALRERSLLPRVRP